MTSVHRGIAILLVAAVLPATAVAQRSAAPPPRGVLPPASVKGESVRDTALVTLLNGVRVVRDSALLRRALELKVLVAPGDYAGVDENDAMTTRVWITVSEIGEAPAQRAYALPELYDPGFSRISVEGNTPVVYITYGAAEHRSRIRVAADLDGVSVRPALTR